MINIIEISYTEIKDIIKDIIFENKGILFICRWK